VQDCNSAPILKYKYEDVGSKVLTSLDQFYEQSLDAMWRVFHGGE